MSRAEALAEARKRWGPNGYARATREERPEGFPERAARRRTFVFTVGVYKRRRHLVRGKWFTLPTPFTKGWGTDYASAFADADRRTK